MSGQGGPRLAQAAHFQAKRVPCQVTGHLVRSSNGAHIRPSGPISGKQSPISGHGFPLWANGAISGRGPGVRPMRTQIRPRGPISSKEGFVSCNLASFWTKGTSNQAKGPYVKQRGVCVRQRDPFVGPGGPRSGQGEGPHFRQRGPRVRPREPNIQAKGAPRSAQGTQFQAKRAPCQATQNSLSGQGGVGALAIKPRATFLAKG